MRSPFRLEKLADRIRAVVAELIARELQDPRIGFSTVTAVRLSTDLQHAKIYVSVLGSEEQQKTSLQGLISAAGFVRHEIRQRLRLRSAPELQFILDRTEEKSARISELLEGTKPEPQP